MTPSPPRRTLLALSLAALCLGPARAADEFTIKEAKADPPKEVNEAVRKALDERSVQLLDGGGNALCQVWFRKEVPAKATAEQVKNGLTFREVPETTLLAVLRVEKPMRDYRKQPIKEGVYTLRLSYQPMDGDHMGTAPNNEFCLLVPAADDKSPEPVKPKALHEMSTQASGSTHPAIFLLFPLNAKPDAAPKLSKDPNDHWILARPVEFKAGELKATLGLLLTLVGTSSAA
jgi:hypothetical protein